MGYIQYLVSISYFNGRLCFCDDRAAGQGNRENKNISQSDGKYRLNERSLNLPRKVTSIHRLGNRRHCAYTDQLMKLRMALFKLEHRMSFIDIF